MGPNGGQATVTEVTNQEIDEELLNKITNLKVRSRSQAFYLTLKLIFITG